MEEELYLRVLESRKDKCHTVFLVCIYEGQTRVWLGSQVESRVQVKKRKTFRHYFEK